MYSYKYPRPSVTVDCILVSPNNSILLIQRAGEPFKDKWAIPGGFIEMDESLEVACHRELEEETGIKVNKLTQFKAYGAVDRDPRGRTISVVFYSFVDGEIEAKAGDDAANAQWFLLDKLPPLAFDHYQIIEEFKKQVLTVFHPLPLHEVNAPKGGSYSI
jgi:8-oxo-dGTP diphosphatase